MRLPVYGVLTELPAVFLLYDSPFWSGTFLVFIFAVSVWNGGGFYIEVFGRKYVLQHFPFLSGVIEGLLGSSVNWKRYGKNWQKQRHDRGDRALLSTAIVVEL
jgi:hypothetical protein